MKKRNPVRIVAEAGVNHNGNIDKAFQLVDVAAGAGADAVKFQTFKTENIVTRNAEKAKYQKESTGSDESQFCMLKQLELSWEAHYDLKKYCKEKGIEFLSTPFDSESLAFLVNDLGLKVLKIPSGEITNGPLLLEFAQTRCELIVSTGMATIEEIEEALSVIAFGLKYGADPQEKPSRHSFKKIFSSSNAKKLLRDKVTLLHCTTQYPAPVNEINLNAIPLLNKVFGLKVGFSDHSEGTAVPIAAAAIGAVLIEKHFTLDKTSAGPDHKASLDPEELGEMVSSIRKVEKALGEQTKQPMPSEIGNRKIARKSLVTATDIKKGDLFTKSNLTIKRPGTGRSPMEYWDLLGTRSQKDYSADEVLS